MAKTPFSQAPPPEPVRGAALQGIRERGPAPQPAQPGAPQPGAPGMAPAGNVAEMFAQLTQVIMQTGLTDEVIAAFEQFIQFFQGVVQQATGGAQPVQAPAQAPPVAGPPAGPTGPPMGPPGVPVG